MCGVIAFAPGRRRRKAAAGRGLVNVNTVCKAGQVVARQQLRYRVAHVIRITKQAAVAVSPAQHFQHVMAALYRCGALPGQALEHRQALCQGHATRGGRWGADQLALVGQRVAQGLALGCAVVGQVVQAPDSARVLHTLNHGLGSRARVEPIAALFGQSLQGDRQFGLADLCTQLGYFTVREKQTGALWVVTQCAQAHLGPIPVDTVDGKALVGQANSRCQGASKWQLAVMRSQIG